MIWNCIGYFLYKVFLFKQGLYIKLGQILSNQYASFNKDFLQQMKKLQHNVPSTLTEDEYTTIVNQINDKITNIKLVESGSVAVIFKGEYDGNIVAIKIVKPGLQNMFTQQSENIKWWLSILPAYYNNLNLIKRWDYISNSLMKQLNMKQEAEYISFFNKNHSYVKVPKLYDEFTTENIVVMEWIDGTLLSHIHEINIDVETKKDLGSCFAMFLKEAHELGKIHMDLHPGNVIITNDHKIAIIDYGLIFDVELEKSKLLFKLIQCLFKGQYEMFIETFMKVYISNENEVLKQKLLDMIYMMKNDIIDKPYILIKKLYEVCESEGEYMDHSLADFEIAMATSKDTFIHLWDMNNREFYALIS